MLVVFYGKEYVEVRLQALRYVSEYAEKEGAGLVRIEAEGYVSGLLRECLGAETLFGGSRCYLVDMPSDNDELSTELSLFLPDLATSPLLFVVIADSLTAEEKRSYLAARARVNEIKVASNEKRDFALTDALCERDKKVLWMLLVKAMRDGERVEEVAGKLWWQIKLMLLAERTDNAEAAGVSDFPYRKAKRALKKYKKGELLKLAASLLQLYHDAHAGRRDFWLGLERWALAL